MRLKHIKLAGFKTFVDPTTVSFPGNRCAVVGPNGCGKSNIIDAVRWVMGESSARQLRGESLTDVIFNGSNTRKPTSLAAIELIFDNSDGRLQGEYAGYSEIAIRREVARDSQSAYFLNGSKCRRRDIMDIFLGTGFGPRSYSIIEQGMISQLVEARPEELRVYLEEAAGISKYKERRRETENRIRHTRENLDRLNDIREELERQLAHLKRQARAAERYRTLKADERTRTAELYTLRLKDLEAQLERSEDAIRRLEVALERVVADNRAVESEIERQRAAHGEETETFNRVQGRFYQLGADIARLEEAIQYNQKRAEQLTLDLEGLSQRREETERQLAMDETRIETLAGALAEVEPRVEAARARDEASSGALEVLERQAAEQQRAWEAFGTEQNDHQRTSEVLASRLEHLEQVMTRLRDRLRQLDDESQDGTSRTAPGEVNELAAEIERTELRHRGLEVELDACLRNASAAREDLLVRDQVLEGARDDVQTLRHELASLEALQRAALGRGSGGADGWLEAQNLAGAPRLGEQLSVVPGWERALETVLGDAIQALHVESLAEAAAALTGLTDGTVILHEGRVRAPERGDLPSLISFVRSPFELGSLLAHVYAAESVAVALAHREQLAAGESIVTRDGVWLGPDWVKVDRGPADESSIIERGQSLDVLGQRLAEAEQHLAEHKGRLVDGRHRVERLDGERDALQARSTRLKESLARLRTDHGVHRVRLEESEARRQRLDRERAELEAQIRDEQSRLDATRRELAEAEQQRERLAAELARHQAARDERFSELTDTRRRAREDRDAFHTLSAERSNLTAQLDATRIARERLEGQQRELAERRRSLADGIEQSLEPLPGLKQELSGKLGDRHAVEQELAEIRRSLETIDSRIRDLDGQRAEREAELETMRGRLEEARLERQSMRVKRGGVTEQLQATGIAYEDAAAALPGDATEEGMIESLERLARRIERLGPINLAAIEEFDAQSERKEYLDAQHQDLTDALETLTGAIRKIDRETRIRFKETFEVVNRHLGELFPKVFGGGHAYLELTGDDLLDTGITLMARPPGKRNASVHLLSGGEKAMTAVALIFAIFQLNPSPVCLLDEVDAPLDDVNVLRFAELIRGMSEDVQFVVITHNKLTMELADHLMGVTMNEPGVSRLVSVDVEEAAAMAAV